MSAGPAGGRRAREQVWNRQIRPERHGGTCGTGPDATVTWERDCPGHRAQHRIRLLVLPVPVNSVLPALCRTICGGHVCAEHTSVHVSTHAPTGNSALALVGLAHRAGDQPLMTTSPGVGESPRPSALQLRLPLGSQQVVVPARLPQPRCDLEQAGCQAGAAAPDTGEREMLVGTFTPGRDG